MPAHNAPASLRHRGLHSVSQGSLCSPQDGKENDSLLGAATELVGVSVPQLLQYKDVPKASASTRKAFAADPLDHYLTDTPDGRGDNRGWQALHNALFYAQLYREVHEKTAWTINHGEAYIRLFNPQDKESLLSRLILYAIRALDRLSSSRERTKRKQEFRTKTDGAVAEVLGARAAQMVVVNGLATAPESQGRGYASALVRVAIGLADARGVGSYLFSSNTANRGFYGSLGYKAVRTLWLGADNPLWTAEPVPVDLMVREPTSASEKITAFDGRRQR